MQLSCAEGGTPAATCILVHRTAQSTPKNDHTTAKLFSILDYEAPLQVAPGKYMLPAAADKFVPKPHAALDLLALHHVEKGQIYQDERNDDAT